MHNKLLKRRGKMKKILFVLLMLLMMLTLPAHAWSEINTYTMTIDEFTWEEIDRETGTGIPKDAWPNLQKVDIGFNFTFYDNIYSYVYISPWGYLTFNNLLWGYCRIDTIPTEGGSADNFIAGLWGYLHPGV